MLEEAEKQISDIEEKIMENNDAEQKRERRIMQHDNRLRELSDSMKHSNILIIEVPEDKERERGQKNYFKK